MARKERTSQGRMMRPNYFVFCEGDSEVAYVETLRSHYRLPIHIIAKKTLLNITPALVERCKATYIQTKSDQTFLMYDLDVRNMFERLHKVPGATLLCSNPCFELWLLLHFTEQNAELTSEECVNRLSSFVKQYKKGTLSTSDRNYLIDNTPIATERAKRLSAFNNPSTSIYLLTDQLDELKKQWLQSNI